MTGHPMPSDRLKQALSKIYNKWYLKWDAKGGTFTDEDWQKLTAEQNFIVRQYPQFPFVEDLLLAFRHEFEARASGNYALVDAREGYQEGFQ